ncbi:hypothetical protein J6590_040351 [Homalodisca vitripennis]|nr:hypothetical protein J6590_040351 [Homalodisca vitripennis]
MDANVDQREKVRTGEFNKFTFSVHLKYRCRPYAAKLTQEPYSSGSEAVSLTTTGDMEGVAISCYRAAE